MKNSSESNLATTQLIFYFRDRSSFIRRLIDFNFTPSRRFVLRVQMFFGYVRAKTFKKDTFSCTSMDSNIMRLGHFPQRYDTEQKCTWLWLNKRPTALGDHTAVNNGGKECSSRVWKFFTSQSAKYSFITQIHRHKSRYRFQTAPSHTAFLVFH